MKREFTPELQAKIDKIPPQMDIIFLLLVMSLGFSVFTILEQAVLNIVLVTSNVMTLVAHIITLFLIVLLLVIRNARIVNDTKIKWDAVLNEQYNYSAVRSWKATAYPYQLIKVIVKHKLVNTFHNDDMGFQFTKTGVHVSLNTNDQSEHQLSLVTKSFSEPENVARAYVNDKLVAMSFDITLDKMELQVPDDIIELSETKNTDN